MNQIELLRHVADNLEAGRAAGIGLLFNECSLVSTSISNIWWGKSNLYTLAPRTHEVNGFTVPAPIDVEPSINVVYYTAAPASRNLIGCVAWTGSEYCLLMLARNVLFATKEAAQQNALAMLGRDPVLGIEGV